MSPAGPAAALLCALALAPGEPSRGSATEPLWQHPAAEACRVRLDQPEGSVRVVTGGTTARLLGEPGLWQATARQIDAEIRLTVTAIPARTGAAAGGSRVILEAPAACELSIRTGQGAVEVLGPRLGRLEVETVTGDITLWVSPPGGAVEVATSGEITVDFSVTIRYLRHQEPAKLGQIQAGSGVGHASLLSRRGAVRVLRQRQESDPDDSPETGVGP